MKPTLIDRSSRHNAFTIAKHQYPHFLNTWHFHPELELVFITKSCGTHFIGNSIENFKPQDLVLIGSNLPHLWQNEDEYFHNSTELIAEAIVIHFRKDFAGDNLINCPQMKSIKEMIRRSGQGIKFSSTCASVISPKLEKLINEDGFEKLTLFLTILNQLSLETDVQLLSCESFTIPSGKVEDKRLDSVYKYILTNFNEKITLEQGADLANMNPSAFSRYFKKVNNKNFSTFLNEIRIGYACKLLLEEQLTVMEICYASGFNNISNFNRQFKKFMDFSPTEYRAQFVKGHYFQS